jgi:hypothetical protein
MKVARLSAAFTPRKYSWYSFLLEAESTPEPQCGRKDYVNENSNDTIGNRSRVLPVYSAVPQPLRHRFVYYIRYKCVTVYFIRSYISFTRMCWQMLWYDFYSERYFTSEPVNTRNIPVIVFHKINSGLTCTVLGREIQFFLLLRCPNFVT